jgi:uncharacterized protein (TIGR03435 family)
MPAMNKLIRTKLPLKQTDVGSCRTNSKREQTSLMMQSLLTDRFKLKVHFESRELPVYALVFAKGGPKLPAAKELPPTIGDNQPRQSVKNCPVCKVHPLDDRCHQKI